MIFLAGGIAILVAIIWVLDRYEVSQRFWSGAFVFLATIVAIPVYFFTRRLETQDRRIFKRQLSIMLFVVSLPVLLYWALVEGVDPVIITAAAFFGAIASIVLLSWSLLKHFKRG
jgi:hypothetical protein